jgi:hypothetical protein
MRSYQTSSNLPPTHQTARNEAELVIRLAARQPRLSDEILAKVLKAEAWMCIRPQGSGQIYGKSPSSD